MTSARAVCPMSCAVRADGEWHEVPWLVNHILVNRRLDTKRARRTTLWSSVDPL